MAKPDWGSLQHQFLAEHAKSGISPKDWCEARGLNYTSARRYIKKPTAQKNAQKKVRNAQTEQAPTTAQYEQSSTDAQTDIQESAQPFNLRNYGLNDMQIRFVEEYLLDLNRTAAYKRAGYKGEGNTAYVNASRLLRNAKVSQAIRDALDERSRRVKITQDEVLKWWWDIATADATQLTGYRLDVIGRIVGLHRSVPAVIARVFFGFDGHLNTAGFDSKSNAAYVGAPFYSKFSPAYGDYQLADNEYRRFLRVKIARNAAGATIASDDRVSLQDVIQTAFNGEAYVTDRKDMTLALNVSPRVSVEELRLIVKLGLLPKPAGVRYDYFYQVTPGLTFGFSRNPSARGFASKFNTAYQGGFFSRKIHV